MHTMPELKVPEYPNGVALFFISSNCLLVATLHYRKSVILMIFQIFLKDLL